MLIFRRSKFYFTASVSGRAVHRLGADCIYYRTKELCIKLVIKTSSYYDARSEKHQIILQSHDIILAGMVRHLILGMIEASSKWQYVFG
jgi:hypothetical protein